VAAGDPCHPVRIVGISLLLHARRWTRIFDNTVDPGDVRFEVAQHDVLEAAVVLTLMAAPVRPVVVSDAFVVRAGCDKRLETCAGRFANAVNFRGFPHIPGNDAVIRYAKRDGSNSGQPL
jgi:uncharacterized phage protein (TIGR02218 family)